VTHWRSLLPPPEHVVQRPRLLELLDRGANVPLTLVSSPAGTGKSVVVATWLDTRVAAGPIICVTLTELDVAAGMPWWLISAELRMAGLMVRDTLGCADRLSINAIADAIATHPQRVTLILDCAAELSPDTVAGLDQLLVQAEDRLRLILLTRSDPPLPMHRYRMRGAVVEVRLADLAFTPAEAQELFARRGLHVGSEDLRLVVARTRGWAAGLALAAMAIAHSSDPARAVREFTGDSGAVAEYLLAEVLNVQPAPDRGVLLRTSVVDVLRPGLIQALAGEDAPGALERLTRGNAFVERLPGQPGSYHYHPLFRELLCAQLSYEAPDEARRLQLVAADWAAQAGMLAEAVHTAVEVDGWEVAAGYVVQKLAIAELLTPKPTALHELMTPPPDRPAGTAAAALVRAGLAAGEGRQAACTGELERARQLTAAEGPDHAAALTLAVVTAVDAGLAEDDGAVLDAAARVDELLADEGAAELAPPPELLIVLRTAAARALLSRGLFSAATDACTEVVAQGLRSGFEREHVECLGHLALIAALLGQNRRAVRQARQALVLAARAGLSDASTAAAETALAWADVEMNDLLRARQHVLAAAAMKDAAMGVAVRVGLALVEARIHRADGDLTGARAALSTCPSETRLSAWLKRLVAAEEAALAGETAASGSLLTDGPVPGALAPLVARRLVEARRQFRRGCEEEAVESLEQALRLAAPERLRRPFVDTPAEVRGLLHAHQEVTRRHGWLALDVESRHARNGAANRTRRLAVPAPSAPVVSESLTEKEREVLGHLAELLTTEETAGAMFVSVNTIRTHVRNLLRKLGASRRNEAIRRARHLGILDD
jgi:LuxR family maltose regulon positive regulatory protein